MRLAVWNANMAVHRKLDVLVDRYRPDVVVVPECANLDLLTAKYPGTPTWSSACWMGAKPTKGLGVFAFGDFRVAANDAIRDDLEWIIPVDVTGPTDFALLAVWSMNRRASVLPVGLEDTAQPIAAVEVFEDWYRDRPLVIAGDFNNHVVWDSPKKPRRNFSLMVATAESRGLVSAYHQLTGETLGEETVPTMYWRNRTVDGPRYNVDHIFLPRSWTDEGATITVGTHEDWIASKLSDHVPLVVDLPAARGPKPGEPAR
jgi:exodeoxyribonuclease-3